MTAKHRHGALVCLTQLFAQCQTQWLVSIMPDSLTSSYPVLCTSDIRYTVVTTGLSVTASAMSHAYKSLSKVDRFSLTKYLANSSTTHCPLSNRHKQSHGEPVELFTPHSQRSNCWGWEAPWRTSSPTRRLSVSVSLARRQGSSRQYSCRHVTWLRLTTATGE